MLVQPSERTTMVLTKEDGSSFIDDEKPFCCCLLLAAPQIHCTRWLVVGGWGGLVGVVSTWPPEKNVVVGPSRVMLFPEYNASKVRQ